MLCRRFGAISVFLILVSAASAPIFFAGGASAAQISATLVPEFDSGTGVFTGAKFLELSYPAGSAISKEFSGANERVSFTVNGTADPSSVKELVTAINSGLMSRASTARVSSVDLKYTYTLRGGADSAVLAVKVDLLPRFSGLVLAESQVTTNRSAGNSTTPQASPMIVDMDWRGFAISQPIIVSSANYSRVDINNLVQALRFSHRAVADQLMSSGEPARQILTEPIVDFGEIGKTDLNKWDSLFDPTRIQVSGSSSLSQWSASQNLGSAKVISVYSLGQCSLKQGCPPAQEKFADAAVSGVPLRMHLTTPPPNAEIQIAGYATIRDAASTQVLAVTLSDSQAQTNEFFPIQVLVVLGGMMGGIAVFVLVKARK